MRPFVLLGFLLLPVASAHAQATGEVIGGISSAKVTATSGNVSETTDSRVGFVAGLGLVASLSKDVALAPEFLYVQKGFAFSGDGATEELRVSYIEIPLLLRLRMGHGPTHEFLTAGPHVAFKVGCSASIEDDQGSASESCTSSGGDDLSGFTSTDFGLTVGAGIATRNITLSIRYDLGLANVSSISTDNITVHNSALLFLVSVAVR